MEASPWFVAYKTKPRIPAATVDGVGIHPAGSRAEALNVLT